MRMLDMTQARSGEYWLTPVTDELLEKVVKQICSVGSPLKIVLFGSRAKSAATAESDVDLLIIEKTGVNCRKRRWAYRDALNVLPVHEDLLVVTIDEVLSWRNVPNHVISEAIREGKVLYEDSRRLRKYTVSPECSSRDRTSKSVQEGIEPKTTCDLARDWFRLADGDLSTAELIAEQGETFSDACFHAQQAIEKYLKGFLILHGKKWPRIHELDKLRWQCLQITDLPDLPRESLQRITEYAFGRYKPDFIPQRKEARDALSVAKKIRKAILKAVPEQARPVSKLAKHRLESPP